MRRKGAAYFLIAGLLASPLGIVSSYHQPVAEARVVEGRRMVSLGGSLNVNQVEETKRLLGASGVQTDLTLTIDGPTINRYLRDGSNASTIVYSSAYIESRNAGHGVQVQIVTPSTIQQVTPTTYQNAAITAGAKDVLIRIAAVSPVTGEGALAGIYALYDQSGVALDTHSIEVAELEIEVIQGVRNQSQVTDQEINQIITEIKKEIVVQIQNNVEINDQSITTIVNNVIDNSNVTINQTEINEIVNFAEEFSQTETAHDEDTLEQLEQSQVNVSWSTTLSELDPSQMTPIDVGSLDYSDAETYHPIFQAMANKLQERISQNQSVLDLYSHSLLLEAYDMNFSPKEMEALNTLRLAMFQHTASSHLSPTLLREIWLESYLIADALRSADPLLFEILQTIGIQTGYSPYAYVMDDIQQDGQKLQVMVQTDEGDHLSTMDTVIFSLADQTVESLNNLEAFSFKSFYGVDLGVTYQPSIDIPADFQLPGAVPVTTDESTEDTEQKDEADEGVESDTPAEGEAGESTEEMLIDPASEDSQE